MAFIKNKNQSKSRRTATPSLALSTRKTGGPMDPPPMDFSVRHTQRVAIASTEFTGGVTYANLSQAIPGHILVPNYWKHVRLLKVSVWDVAGKGISVRFPTDVTTFNDVGVPGSRASNVHVTPPLETRMRWVPLSGPSVTAFFVNASAEESAYCQATIEFTT